MERYTESHMRSYRDRGWEQRFWYFLDFKFIASEWKYYNNTQELPVELVARNFNDTICTISRLNPPIARENLGIFLAVDENQRAQI